MELINNFTSEVKAFLKNNWWVCIMYAVLLSIVFVTQEKQFVSIVVVTSLHFVADIFIMMMFSAYTNKQYARGTYFQIISSLIFLSIKIYTGWSGKGWHYLLADPIYILAAVKNYKIDVSKTDLKSVNYKTMTALSLLIIFAVIMAKVFFKADILSSPSEWVQTAGIFLFAIALSTTESEQLRYEFSLIALIAMVGGSAWEMAIKLEDKSLAGLALSYTLLPLTVLVFYVKRWTSFLQRSHGAVIV